jgi:adhesin/invasin
VSFNANTTGVPTQIAIFNGNNQAAVQGTAVATPPSVRVTDLNGQGVGGATVTFAVSAGGGAVTNGSVVTDAAGVATVGSWTLGNAATQSLTATVAAPSVAGNPVTFSATAATQIAITQQPPANVASGANFTVTVQLRNASNALASITGVPLTIAIQSGPGVLVAGATALTVNTSSGNATFNVNITGSGVRTLVISGAGLGSIVTTTVTIP